MDIQERGNNDPISADLNSHESKLKCIFNGCLCNGQQHKPLFMYTAAKDNIFRFTKT